MKRAGKWRIAAVGLGIQICLNQTLSITLKQASVWNMTFQLKKSGPRYERNETRYKHYDCYYIYDDNIK